MAFLHAKIEWIFLILQAKGQYQCQYQILVPYTSSFINYCTELKYSIKLHLSLFSTNGIPLFPAVIREVTGMLPFPSKSLQPSSLLYPPPPLCGRIHAYLNLSNSSKERSLPPVILPLRPCPFPVRSIKTRAFFKGAVCSCIISCVSTEPLTSSGCWSRNHPENFSHSQKSLLMLIQV